MMQATASGAVWIRATPGTPAGCGAASRVLLPLPTATCGRQQAAQLPQQQHAHQRAATVVAHAFKATRMENPDDLATGYKVKPEQRVTRQFNVRAMIGDCGDWRTLGELVGDAHAKFERDKGLAAAALVQLTTLLTGAPPITDINIPGLQAITRHAPPPPKGSPEHASAMSLFSQLVQLVVANLDKARGDDVARTIGAIASLEYKSDTAVKALLLYCQLNCKRFKVAEVFSVLASFHTMGVKVPPGVLQAMLESALRAAKYVTAVDLNNAGMALSGLPRGAVPRELVLALQRESTRNLQDMSPQGLAQLLTMLAAQGVTPRGPYRTKLLEALMPRMGFIKDPRAIVGLLGGLMAAGAELGDEVLDAVEAAVMGSDGAGMSQLGAGELGVLGGVAAMLAPEPLFTTPEAAGLYLERVSQCMSTLDERAAASVLVGLAALCTEEPQPPAAAGGAAPAAATAGSSAGGEGARVLVAAHREALEQVLPDLLELSEAHLTRSPPTQLARLAAALRDLGAAPDEHFVKAFADSVVAAVPKATSYEGLVSLVNAVTTHPALCLPPTHDEKEEVEARKRAVKAAKAAKAAAAKAAKEAAKKAEKEAAKAEKEAAKAAKLAGQGPEAAAAAAAAAEAAATAAAAAEESAQHAASFSKRGGEQGGVEEEGEEEEPDVVMASGKGLAAGLARWACKLADTVRPPSPKQLQALEVALDLIPGVDLEDLVLPEPEAEFGGSFGTFGGNRGFGDRGSLGFSDRGRDQGHGFGNRGGGFGDYDRGFGDPAGARGRGRGMEDRQGGGGFGGGYVGSSGSSGPGDVATNSMWEDGSGGQGDRSFGSRNEAGYGRSGGRYDQPQQRYDREYDRGQGRDRPGFDDGWGGVAGGYQDDESGSGTQAAAAGLRPSGRSNLGQPRSNVGQTRGAGRQMGQEDEDGLVVGGQDDFSDFQMMGEEGMQGGEGEFFDDDYLEGREFDDGAVAGDGWAPAAAGSVPARRQSTPPPPPVSGAGSSRPLHVPYPKGHGVTMLASADFDEGEDYEDGWSEEALGEEDELDNPSSGSDWGAAAAGATAATGAPPGDPGSNRGSSSTAGRKGGAAGAAVQEATGAVQARGTAAAAASGLKLKAGHMEDLDLDLDFNDMDAGLLDDGPLTTAPPKLHLGRQQHSEPSAAAAGAPSRSGTMKGSAARAPGRGSATSSAGDRSSTQAVGGAGSAPKARTTRAKSVTAPVASGESGAAASSAGGAPKRRGRSSAK